MAASAQGEDRSDFQSVYGWQGLDFGFVKATEGTGWTGKTFPANWHNLKAQGKPRGAYHFLHPGESAAGQAQHFLDTVKAQGLQPGDMLVADVEVFDGLNGAEVDAATKAFYDELVRLGVNPAHNPIITYTNHFVGMNLHKTAAAYPLLWFAWPSSTAPGASLIAPFTAWKFWQWGIVGGVDRDAFDGTVTDLAAWLATYTGATGGGQRVPETVVTDGTISLKTLCGEHGDSTLAVLIRTFSKLAFQPALLGYILSSPLLTKVMPAGISLILMVNP